MTHTHTLTEQRKRQRTNEQTRKQAITLLTRSLLAPTAKPTSKMRVKTTWNMTSRCMPSNSTRPRCTRQADGPILTTHTSTHTHTHTQVTVVTWLSLYFIRISFTTLSENSGAWCSVITPGNWSIGELTARKDQSLSSLDIKYLVQFWPEPVGTKFLKMTGYQTNWICISCRFLLIIKTIFKKSLKTILFCQWDQSVGWPPPF